MNPWDNEPNRKEWEAHGLKCVIVRQDRSGHLCGYVGLPKSHPLHGVDYNTPHPALAAALTQRMGEPTKDTDGFIAIFIAACKDSDAERATMDVALDVHGGVTYSRDGLHGYKGNDLWWIGFDCNHSGDFAPRDTERGFTWRIGGTYRDMAYVTEQTEGLARQLSEIRGDAA